MRAHQIKSLTLIGWAFFLPVAPVLARFRVAMRCRRAGNALVSIPANNQNHHFSPFDLWLADARPLDFMRVSERWLCGNSTDGSRAQHFATVRPENKVCRVCGSHPVTRASLKNATSVLAWAAQLVTAKVRTWVSTRFAGLHPERTKTAWDGSSMLARVCSQSGAENRQNGHPIVAHGHAVFIASTPRDW